MVFSVPFSSEIGVFSSKKDDFYKFRRTESPWDNFFATFALFSNVDPTERPCRRTFTFFLFFTLFCHQGGWSRICASESDGFLLFWNFRFLQKFLLEIGFFATRHWASGCGPQKRLFLGLFFIYKKKGLFFKSIEKFYRFFYVRF